MATIVPRRNDTSAKSAGPGQGRGSEDHTVSAWVESDTARRRHTFGEGRDVRFRKLLLTGCVLSGTACGGGSLDLPIPPDPDPAPDPAPEPVRFSYLYIGGTVTDSTGRPVSGVRIEGGARSRGSERPCGFRFGNVPRRYTFPDGMYRTAANGPVFGVPCDALLFLEFTPPDESGLSDVLAESVEITIEGPDNPLSPTNPLVVDVVLPGVDARPVRAPTPSGPARNHAREVAYHVMGTLKTADGQPVSEAYIESHTLFTWNCQQDRISLRGTTDSLGAFENVHRGSVAADRGCLHLWAARSWEDQLNGNRVRRTVTFLIPPSTPVPPDTVVTHFVLPR